MKQIKKLTKSLLMLFSLSFLSGCVSQTTSKDDTKVNIEEKKDIQDNENKPSEESNVDTNLPTEGDDKENPSTDKEDNSTTDPVQEPDPTPDSPSTPDPESGQDPNPTTDPEDESETDGTTNPDSSITLNKHSLVLYLNGTFTFQCDNKDSSNKVYYSSDIEDIVEINSSGLATGKRLGKTRIIARNNSGDQDSCIVEVKQNPNFKLNKNYMDLYVGETNQITTSVSGTNYTSEDENIATIDSNGNIKAVSAGVVNLVASKNNSIDICQLRVVLKNHNLFEFELNKDNTYSVKGFTSTVSAEDKKNIIIPYNYNNLPVTAISSSAFWDYKTNTKSEKLILPNSIKTIGSSAFMGRGFTQIGTLYLPNELEIIDRFGFENGSFEYIYFPRKEFTLTTCAFQNCHSLKKIYLHEKINLPKDPFHDCYGTGGGIGITHIYLEEGIKVIPEQLCFALHELEYFNIPSSTTEIKELIFYMMKYDNFGIRKLIIPKSVEQITSRLYAFNGEADTLPSPAIQLLCEKEEKPESYSSNNNDSYYFYSKTAPTGEGKFWHYVNNEPTIW